MTPSASGSADPSPDASPSASGSVGYVTVPCCPNPISTVLTLSLQNSVGYSDCFCVSSDDDPFRAYTLTYDAAIQKWASPLYVFECDDDTLSLQFWLYCAEVAEDDWRWHLDVYSETSAACANPPANPLEQTFLSIGGLSSCDPFELTFGGVAATIWCENCLHRDVYLLVTL